MIQLDEINCPEEMTLDSMFCSAMRTFFDVFRNLQFQFSVNL